MSSGDVVSWAGLAAFFAAVLLLWWFARTEAEGQLGRVEMERQRQRREEQRAQRREQRAFLRAAGLRGRALQRAILAGEVPAGEVGSPRLGHSFMDSGQASSVMPAIPPPPDRVDPPVYFPYGSWQPAPLVPATPVDPLVGEPVDPPLGEPADPPVSEPLVVRVAGRHAAPAPAPSSSPSSAPADEHDAETYCPACLCVALERHDVPAGERVVTVGDVASAWMLAGRCEARLCLHHQRTLEAHAKRMIGPHPAQGGARYALMLDVDMRMAVYGARVLARPQARADDKPSYGWHLGEDGTWHRGDGNDDAA